MKKNILIPALAIAIIVVLGIQSLSQFTARNKLKKSLVRVERQLDSSSRELRLASDRLAALKSELLGMQAFMDSTSVRMACINNGQLVSTRHFREEQDLLGARLVHFIHSLDSAREALENIQVEE